jgi:hypothetical protein
MATTVGGVVKESRVVPDSPLPEGARVEIVLPELLPSVSPELQLEFDAWDRASADALDLVEQLAREGEVDDAR